MEFLNLKTPEELFMNVNEEDLLGRIITYVIAQAEDGDERGFYRFHLECANNWKLIVPAAQKKLPEKTKLVAALWTTPKKKKRLFVVGDTDVIKDEDVIRERWKELLPDNPYVAQASAASK